MEMFDKNTFKIGCLGLFWFGWLGFFLIYPRNNQDVQFSEREILNQDGFIENHWYFQHFMMPEIFSFPAAFVCWFCLLKGFCDSMGD